MDGSAFAVTTCNEFALGELMAQVLNRTHIDRSLRLDSHPGIYSCSVRYTAIGETANPRWAQFADISETGMKLISAKPHQTEVGSIVDVNFSLVGGTREVTRKARVVRQGSEFVLGLQFLHTSEDFKYIFWQHARFIQRLPWAWPLQRSLRWFSEHKIGLRMAVAAFTFFIFTASVIYLFSDDHAGRKRIWGSDFSKSFIN